MADYSIVQEALKRGYSLDEIANTLAEHDGLDPSIIRERGYSATDMLSKLGYEQPAPEPQKKSGDFMRGAGEAFQQVPQLGYGLIAGAGALAEKAVGEGGIATGIKKAGVEGYQRWGEKVAEGAKESDSWTTSYNRAKEGDFGSLVDWFQHGLGYAAGQGVQILATAGLGSLAAKGAGVGAMAMAKGMVAKETARIAATKEGAAMAAEQIAKIATANVASKIGQNTALAATAFGMEGGEIYGDLVSEAENEGRELTGAELGKAFVATTGAGLLEFAGDKIGLDLMLGKKVLGMGGVGGRLVRGATGGATGIIGEGLTEYAQTGVEEYGKGNESNPIPFMQSDKSHRQAIDAAALGAVGGGAMGGVGGIIAPQQKDDKPAPTPSDIIAAPDVDTAIQSFTDSLDGADLLDDQQPPPPPAGLINTPQEAINANLPATSLDAQPDLRGGLSAGVEVRPATGTGEVAVPGPVGLIAMGDGLAASEPVRQGGAADVPAQPAAGAGGEAVSRTPSGGVLADAVSQEESDRRWHEDENVKPKILARIASGKDAMIGFMDGYFTAGYGKVGDGLRLNLTSGERKTANKYLADIELADTTEEREVAHKALRIAMRDAVQRALSGERPETKLPNQQPATPLPEQGAPGEVGASGAVAGGWILRRPDNGRVITDGITGKPKTYDSEEAAQAAADSIARIDKPKTHSNRMPSAPRPEQQAPPRTEAQQPTPQTPAPAGVSTSAPNISETLKPAIEQLIKRKAAAGQIRMGTHLVIAISKAKAVMDSGTGKAADFKKLAKQFKGKDEQIHTTLMSIANALEPVTPATKKPQKASSDLLQRIKQLGGIDGTLALDITGEQRAPGGWKFAFKKGGTGLDDLATMLASDGFMIDTSDVDGGVQQLRDMIRNHIGGERNFKAQTQEAQAEAMARDQDLNALAQRADELGINWKNLNAQQLSDAVYEAEDALEMERLDAAENDEEVAALSDSAIDDEIDIPFNIDGAVNNAALASWLGENDGQEGVAGTVQGAVAEGQEAGTGRNGGTNRQEAGAGQEVLQSYTNQEVLDAEARREQAGREEEAQIRAQAAERGALDQADIDARTTARVSNSDNFQFGENSKQAAAPVADLFNQLAAESKPEEILVKQPYGVNVLAGIAEFDLAKEAASNAPENTIVRVRIEKEGLYEHEPVKTLYGAFVANGDGTATWAQATFPASKESPSDAQIMDLAGTIRLNNKETEAKIAEQSRKNKAALADKGIVVGLELQSPSTYVPGKKGMTTFTRAKVVAIDDYGIAEVHATLKGSGKTYVFKADANSRLFEKLEAKSTQEQQATAILDRANVTGKDRLDIMRDFKDGKHSLVDLEAAYPSSENKKHLNKGDLAEGGKERGQWELVNVERRTKLVEYLDAQGEAKTKHVADMDNAEISYGSGIPVANIYWLKDKRTGDVRPFGSETAPQAMGISAERAGKKFDEALSKSQNEWLEAELAKYGKSKSGKLGNLYEHPVTGERVPTKITNLREWLLKGSLSREQVAKRLEDYFGAVGAAYPVADTKDDALEKARKTLLIYTKTGDLYSLAGNAKASVRAHIMAELMGVEKIAQSKAGITAIRDEFYKRAGIIGETSGQQEDNFKAWAQGKEQKPGKFRMDAETLDHLDKWIDANIPPEQQFDVQKSIADFVGKHPEVIERGDSWPEIKALADRAAQAVQFTKESWQMTKAEYIKHQEDIYNREGYVPLQNSSTVVKTFPSAYWARAHQDRVNEAVSAGKPVPSEVLADYPDLKPAQAGQPAETKSLLDISMRTGDRFDYVGRDGGFIALLEVVEPDPYKRFPKVKIVRFNQSATDSEVAKVLLDQEQGGEITLNERDAKYLRFAQAEQPASGDAAHNTEDAGAELTYNKRNRMTRGIRWEDIADKNESLRVKEVTKAKVYPKPDYEAMIAANVLGDEQLNKIAAHLVKQVYDSIATKPQTRTATDAQLQEYITGVNRVMDGVMAWANNREQVADLIRKVSARAQNMRGGMMSISALAEQAPKTLLDTVYPEGYKAHRAELQLIGGNKPYGALQPGVDSTIKAMQDIEKGWPAAQESWQRQGLQVISGESLTLKFYEGKHRDGSPYVTFYVHNTERNNIEQTTIDGATSKDEIEVQQAANGRLAELKDKYLVLGKSRNLAAISDTEEGAIEKAREFVKREAKTDKISEKGWSVEAAERIGVAHRMEGENITSDKLKETFGFKGVNFGNWMKGETKSNVAERQAHLNHAYDAFLDLADIVGVPPKAMSLNGMLGLAIGAQGSGTNLAHFVPGVNEINLTRTGGAGALAHEWAHALDHYFATLAGLGREESPFLTEKVGRGDEFGYTKRIVDGKSVKVKAFSEELRPEVLAQFRAVVQAMTKKMSVAPTEEEAKAQTEYRIGKEEKQVELWLKAIRRDFDSPYFAPGRSAELNEVAKQELLKTFDALASKVRNLEVGDGLIAASSSKSLYPVIAEMRDAYKKATGRVYSLDQAYGLYLNVQSLKHLKDGKYANAEHVPRLINSDYKNASLVAEKNGRKNYWATNLEMFARAFDAYVVDTLAEKAAKNSYLSGIEAVAPVGEERKAIGRAFDFLLAELKTKETDKGVALFSLSPRMDADNIGVDFDVAVDVIARTVAAKKSWNVDILPFSSFDDLPIEVQQATADQYGEKDAKNSKGILHNGKVYIIAENNESEADVEQTILHEVEGHVGIHRLYGKELTSQLNTLFLAIGGKNGLTRLANERGIAADMVEYAKLIGKTDFTDEVRTRIMMDEVLAHYAQHPKFGDRVKAIVGAIRQWLRSNGFAKLAEYGETDLLYILKQGRAQLKTAGEGDNATSLMVAWHGSPHDHDKFDSSKIGTGEGAAAYGFGLYFAGNRDVAEYYKRSIRSNLEGLQAIAEEVGMDEEGARLAADSFQKNMTFDAFETIINMPSPIPAIEAYRERIRGQIDSAYKAWSEFRREGKLYQVELAPEADEYLLWDKPLSEQSEKVRESLQYIFDDIVNNEKDHRVASVLSRKYRDNYDNFLSNSTGESLYKHLAAKNDTKESIDPSGDKAASDTLHAAGIRGIKYLDGSSRSKQYEVVLSTSKGEYARSQFDTKQSADAYAEKKRGEGFTAKVQDNESAHHNFVIFDDNDVSITAKFSQSAAPVNNPFTLSGLKAAINSAFTHVKDFAGLLEATGKVHFISKAESRLVLKQASKLKGSTNALDANTDSATNGGQAVAGIPHANGKVNIPFNTNLGRGDMSAITDKASADSVLLDTKRISNLLKTPTFRKHGFGGLNIEAQNSMLTQMLFAGQDRKILNSVVSLIPIDVMNVLREKHLAPQVLFHDKAMLLDALTGNGVFGGSVSPVSMSDFVREVTILGAKVKPTLGKVVGRSNDDLAAISASGLRSSPNTDANTLIGTKPPSAGLNLTRPFEGGFSTNTANTTNFRHDETVLAFVYNGEVYFIYDAIDKSTNIAGLLKHEISLHALKLGRTDAEFQAILKQIETLRKMGNKKIQAARDRVPADTAPEATLEEQAGYLIESNPDLPIIQKLIARFRALLRSIGAKLPVMQRMQWFKWANELTVEDIVLMAQDAMKTAPEALKTAETRGTFLAGASDQLYSQLRVAIRDMNDKIFQGSAANVRLHLMNNLGKYGVKKDEIFWTGLTEFLSGTNKVSKADVLAFLDENAVVTKDVVLGEKKPEPYDISQLKIEEHSDSWVARDSRNLIMGEVGKAIAKTRSEAETILKNSIAERENEASKERYDSDLNRAKFPTQVLPGGRDYRELLMTLPGKPIELSTTGWKARPMLGPNDTTWAVQDERGYGVGAVYSATNEADAIAQMAAERGASRDDKNFRSSHYPDHPNLIAHVRLNARDDAQGRTGSFIEEQQSDASIAASKSGFRGRSAAEIDAELAKEPEGTARAQELIAELGRSNFGVPPMPFVTSSAGKGSTAHTLLSLKKTILYAIEQGHEFISWTTGAQQKDRYKLSKQIDSIKWIHEAGGEKDLYGKGFNILAYKDGESVINKYRMAEHELADTVGKGVAEQIIKAQKAGKTEGEISGVNLDIGGEWADALYGDENGLDANGKPSLMSQAVKEVARQLGVELRVEGIELGHPREGRDAASHPAIQPSFTITPELRSKVTSAGMPLFSKKAYSSSYEVQPEAARNLPIDGATLVELRRAAAGIESAERGITFTVNADGKAIVTGLARVKVPDRFQRFANEHGLTLVVQRADTNGGFANSNTAMPLENREAGALYFGEMGSDHLDRTGKTRFSLHNKPTEGMSVGRVQRATAKLRASWHGFRLVNIVQSFDELPHEIRMRSSHSVGEGLYDPRTNIVYLIADNITNPERAVWVAIHEVVGHGGIRMLGKPVADTLDFAGKNGFVKKLAQAIAADRGETFDATTHTDEAIAELAAATITGKVDVILDRYGIKVPTGMRSNLLGMIQRVVDAVRNFIGRVTGKPVEAVSDGEVLGLIRRMKDAVEGKAQGYDTAGVSNGALASTAKAQDQTQTEAFRKWFSGSVVTENGKADGKPLMVYHGTDAEFDTFVSDSGAHYFVAEKDIASGYSEADAEPKGVYVSIKNPKVFERKDREGKSSSYLTYEEVEALVDAGYDGVIGYMDGTSFKEYVTFEPTQIKSAIGNRGTFDQNDSNILMSRAPAQKPIPGMAQPPAQPPRPIVESLAQEYGRPMGELLNMFDRNQIVQMYEKSLPELRDYKHEQEAIVADRNKAMYEADGFLDKLRAVPMALRDKFATLAHEATIAGIDPSEEYQDNDQTKELRRMESILEERAKEGALPDSQKALLKHTKRLLADVPETYRKLRVQFQTMSKEQRELFVALRDQYRENGKRVFDAFAERVERMKASPEAKASAIQELRAQYDKMKKGIYFPLARFGDHVLIGTKEIDGIKTRTVEYYETEKAANEARRRMAKDGYQTKISKRKDAIADSGANKALAGVIEKVRSLQESGGVAGKAELDLLLDGLNQSMIQMLPDQSYRRHFMHRKNTPGYSADFIRAYADSMWHSASHIAGLKHGDKVTASIEAMQNRIDSEQTGDTSALQDVVNHLIYREERLREGTNKTVAFIGQAGFLSALASVSNFFINLTQTPMLTLPHLGGRYGFGQASMQLLSGLNAQVRAMKTAKTLTDMKHVMDIRNRLQGVEKDLMTRLHDMGKIDLSGSHDLIDAANRDAPRPDSAWDVAMRVAAFPQHASEVINRQVTALAAIRLEMKKSGNIDDALNAAVEAIDQTHYDYEKSNRAMLMHGNTQRVIFMFKQYAQKTAFLWARTAYLAVGGDNASPEVKKIARKQLAGMVAMQAALSGVLGLPIFLEAGVVASGVVGFKLGGKTGAYLGVAGAAILIAISAATDDDEDEFDAEVRKALSGMAGKEWGEVLARGAVRLTGVDISGRVNADELFIRKPDKSVEGKDARLAWMDAILGYAIGGQAANIYTGLSMMGDGYIYRGAEKIMPVKALRDLMQAGRLAKDGLTTMKGDKLVDDLNMGQIATKALGFQPAEVAEAYERNAAIKGAETILNDQRIKLLDKRWALKQDNDAEGLKDNWADIQEFNKEHPTHRILMQDVYKSFAARKRANQKQVGGITVSRKHKELRDKGSFANVD